ncbi:TRAP transporter substrate-binding protein DctP [Oscillibacter sp.]|uniref:TRAP transporter substrate-binding protein DctP n=1 Tax=Oscillibacter sp. TaxID=1945593 RepID=UPI00289754CB|nr:TRAP transporter substrate-binding protein DctP [Oscillibacter sp.]
MKRTCSLILATAMLLTTLTACGSGSTPSASSASSLAGSSGAADDVITIVYATPEASGMPTDTMSQYVAKKIQERSNGHIVVELHNAGTLGGDTELVSQVMDGTIPLVGLSISALSQYTDLLECTQLPFLLNNYEKEKAALDSDEFAALISEVETSLNLKFLGSAENGMRHFATKDKQITQLEDLKGLKLRTMTSNIIQDTVSRLGANVTTVAYNEVFTSLQNGVIDGEEINVTSAAMQKHYEVVKYFTEIGLYPFPAVYVMNGDYWNKLSAEDQELISQVFAEGHDKAFEEFLPKTEALCKLTCEEGGVTFNTIEDLTPFQDKVADLYSDYSARNEKIAAFVEMAQNLG